MPASDAPFHPIIYMRGYAMSRGEIDETAADPFCGFNLGSTMYRAAVPFDRSAVATNGKMKPTNPGIRGRLRFVIEGWNLDAR